MIIAVLDYAEPLFLSRTAMPSYAFASDVIDPWIRHYQFEVLILERTI